MRAAAVVGDMEAVAAVAVEVDTEVAVVAADTEEVILCAFLYILHIKFLLYKFFGREFFKL